MTAYPPAPGAQPSYGTQPSHGAGGHASYGTGGQPSYGTGGPAGAPHGAGAPAPGTDLGADLQAAMSWTWSTFTRNLAAFLVPGVIYCLVLIGLIIASVVAMFAGIFSTFDPATGEPSPVGLLVGYLLALLVLLPAGLVSMLWSAGAERGAAVVADGGRPTVGQTMLGSGRIILTALLVTLGTMVGAMLCYVPGLIFGVMAMFAIPAAARGARPVDAIAESFRLVKDNLATALVGTLLASAVSSFAGMFLITLVALIPLIALFQFALYERLSRRELVEPRAA